MNEALAFKSVFKNFRNTCYIVELDLDSSCVNKSDDCPICAGTGHVIRKIKKTELVLDAGQMSTGLVKNIRDTDAGERYKELRVAYFLKDCNFDLSPNISRQVLNIVNGKLEDIYIVHYIETITSHDELIFYQAILSRSNLNSVQHIKVYESLIKGR